MTDRALVKRHAYAKVNLALAVGPPAQDTGMHPIASWMAPIDLRDDLTITRLETGSLSRYAILWAEDAPRRADIDWPITRDLTVRAHLLLEREAGRKLPMQLRLDKRIPVGGGLGGGSSDAAALMLAARSLFSLDIPDARLAELAAELGSDVAFFLDPDSSGGKSGGGGGYEGAGPPRPALVEGLGDRITRLDRRDARLLLLLPDFGCPTGPVYRAFDEREPEPLRDEDIRELASSAVIDPESLFNDLALPAQRVEPRLAELRTRIARRLELPVHVSGSGATMFVVASDESHAIELAALLEDIDGVIARITRTL